MGYLGENVYENLEPPPNLREPGCDVREGGGGVGLGTPQNRGGGGWVRGPPPPEDVPGQKSPRREAPEENFLDFSKLIFFIKPSFSSVFCPEKKFCWIKNYTKRPFFTYFS